MQNRFFRVLLDLLFPPKCVFCGKLLETGLFEAQKEEIGYCELCRKELPWNLGERAKRRGRAVTVCVSPFRYSGHVVKSVHRFKKNRRKEYAQVYGRLIADCVLEQLSAQYDVLTFIPSTSARGRQLGYNQSMLLAAECGKLLDRPMLPLLRKVRKTEKQASIRGDEERFANVAGAFSALDSSKAKGKRILLIDDIITTGATMESCAETLLDAGAACVLGAALATARGNRPVVI